MITDQKTIDALKELNYSQVYEKGKEDARQEILDVINNEIKFCPYTKTGRECEKCDLLRDIIEKIEKQLNQPKTEE